MPLHRRHILIGSLAVSASLASGTAWADDAADRLRAIEAGVGGRLGFHALRTGDDQVLSWRADERFLMCSTFKALAVGAVLAKVDRGQERLDRRIPYGAKDLLDYAPVARAHLAEGGLSLGDLCAAAVELSDNTAANLILASLGGPSGVTGFIRAQGDTVTHLDRNEPSLNRTDGPGDIKDTTTPRSMVGLWRKMLLGETLSAVSRGRLTAWLEACQTGPGRLKAATPKGWTIGHKTGTGATTIGDLAIITPPGRPPILIAAYLENEKASDQQCDAALADAGRAALRLFVPNA